jgi:anti-sigma B factor antagonist
MQSHHGSHWMQREDVGDITIVRLKTPRIVDDDITRAVFDPLVTLVTEMGRRNLVLNLASAESLPSLALAKLVVLNRKVSAVNGRLVLCHLSPNVVGVLETTHLNDVLNLCGDEQEALQSFAGT